MDSLIHYLETSSPEDIIKSDVFLSAFRHFFYRARGEQRRQLVQLLSQDQPQSPPQSDLKIHFEYPSTSLPTPPTPFSPPHSPPHSQPASPQHGTEIPTPTSSLSPEEYFKSKKFEALSPKRVNSLIKAAKKLKDADKTSIADFDNLWSSSEQVPQPPSDSVFSRVDSMFNTSLNIQEQHAVLDCASRFISLFIRHEVDVLTLNGSLKLHAAFDRIAKETQWTSKQFKRAYYEAKNFVSILELDGPGYLLRIGSDVNWLWKKFCNKDVEHLRQFREAQCTFPKADDQFHAASLCIQGLIAHGWTSANLAKSDSNLMRSLGLYVDLEQLSEGNIVQREDPGPRGKRSADINDDGPNKRQRRNVSTVDLNEAPTGQVESPDRVYHDIQPQHQSAVGDGDGSLSQNDNTRSRRVACRVFQLGCYVGIDASK
ncbi:uncharacterized protein BDZ99DRAFT_525600 [Mytilinidion resinicola]|uniref:Uncharacterized protein n=1 Tax=Mytilinidion resinicola TaxID=574789 RepID=A0A6A6Y8D6_9PEZI|nr:uncharacterized protein BDZ99DRAFT_525600 [Mytilinidion resinicola]KAF2804395.1 hypothetical protein BDZ99DRAFT_525600 [Mytilinidion resinicola]